MSYEEYKVKLLPKLVASEESYTEVVLPRRCGKTMLAVELSIMLANLGNKVCLISGHEEERYRILQKFQLENMLKDGRIVFEEGGSVYFIGENHSLNESFDCLIGTSRCDSNEFSNATRKMFFYS